MVEQVNSNRCHGRFGPYFYILILFYISTDISRQRENTETKLMTCFLSLHYKVVFPQMFLWDRHPIIQIRKCSWKLITQRIQIRKCSRKLITQRRTTTNIFISRFFHDPYQMIHFIVHMESQYWGIQYPYPSP